MAGENTAPEGADADLAPAPGASSADNGPDASEPEARAESDIESGTAAAHEAHPDPHTESAEELIADLERTTAERDEYLDALQRLKAEFDNHRRRVDEQRAEVASQAAVRLVDRLLPVLDACEAALTHNADAVQPIADALTEALAKEGLEVIAPQGAPFDPTLHEAVMHEASEDSEQTVTEVLRTGYAWNGKVVRAAMVKVRG
jgi:molecular chaperone GrpE